MFAKPIHSVPASFPKSQPQGNRIVQCGSQQGKIPCGFQCVGVPLKGAILTSAPTKWHPQALRSAADLYGAAGFRVLTAGHSFCPGGDDVTPTHALLSLYGGLHVHGSLYSGDRQVGNFKSEETKHVSSALKIPPVHPVFFAKVPLRNMLITY